MNRHRVRTLLAIFTVAISAVYFPPRIIAAEGPSRQEFHGDLEKLASAAVLLGDTWERSPGLIINDVDKVPNPPKTPEDKVVASVADSMRPLGVTAVAEFNFVSKARNPLPDVVTVRVLVFRDTPTAKAFWENKYAAAGAGKEFYEAVDGVGELAVDSKQATKRIALAGNSIVTASQLQGKTEYVKVLDHCLSELIPSDSRQPPPEPVKN